ncbi:ornithine cyclodeaminase family protein [Streptomyces sp. TRM43335]|uniref:Ornithine cyclodeaminase family protein n=1 Tax=Streptomyces taklimakanensis TaxID=2569853 RepID=A0A6G2B6D9_9ACTN|nr:ornithine cyclodeaminase family protein [Streptomyces taklimakanensis]MTE17643.1 ornithine cyclodeaminase family protein [Streptomyces taklimakanensis]
MSVLLLNDDAVRTHLDAPTAVRAVRDALVAAHGGVLHAPPRIRADLGDGHLVFTAGHLRTEKLFGFRAYDTLVGAEQLVAVWGSDDGRLRAVVHGDELGARRTGAIGAVAVDAAARPGPIRLGLVGAGTHAWTQLWAIRAVRQVREVTVVARRPERAEAFARQAAEELGVRARAVRAVEEAVRDHDVVVVATNSTVPVLDADWIAPGTHVTTLGPKTVARHEVPAALADRADVLLTDSLAQAVGYPEPHVLPVERMIDLGAVLAGASTGRTGPDEITVFCSVGLAGTEVAVAAALWEAVHRSHGAPSAGVQFPSGGTRGT